MTSAPSFRYYLKTVLLLPAVRRLQAAEDEVDLGDCIQAVAALADRMDSLTKDIRDLRQRLTETFWRDGAEAGASKETRIALLEHRIRVLKEEA